MSTIAHPHPPRHPDPASHSPPRHGRTLTVLGIVLVVVSLLAVGGLFLRKHFVTKHQSETLSREVDRGPHILVSKSTVSPAHRDITLPAEVRGYFQTTAYAKVSGYVREMRVDKGDRVTKGRILATIESPETDQSYRAAQSDLVLRKQLFARAKLLAPNVVSEQDLETATSNLAVSHASMKSAEALLGYETIRAPYDGIVTMRYVDPGALLPAAVATTSGAQPIVDVADPTRLRIDAYVGQDSAAFVHVGDAVTLWQDQSTKHVPATVARTAGALDPRTRTMLCEIDLDNRDGAFILGAITHAIFHVDTPPVPVIPAESLVFRQGKELVPVIEDGHVHLAPVEIGVSDGRTMQVVSGLRGGEMVALTLPAEVGEGAPVQAREVPPTSGPKTIGAPNGAPSEMRDGGAEGGHE